MDQSEVRAIIESTIKSGSEGKETFNAPKVLKLKSILELCDSIDEVVAVIEDSRVLISTTFGLNDNAITRGLNSIKQLDDRPLGR